MIKNTKTELMTLLSQKWIATPIHYNGLNFDINGKEEWIYVSYEPISAIPSGIAFEGYKEDGIVKITVHSRKENRTFELFDGLLEMFRANSISGIIVTGNKIGSKGVMSTINGDYRYLNSNMYIKNY
jgi:hypothetical protein